MSIWLNCELGFTYLYTSARLARGEEKYCILLRERDKLSHILNGSHVRLDLNDGKVMYLRPLLGRQEYLIRSVMIIIKITMTKLC